MIIRSYVLAKPKHWHAEGFTAGNKPYQSNTKSIPANRTGWPLTVEHRKLHVRPTVFLRPYSLLPKTSNSLAVNQISDVALWTTSSFKCDRHLVMPAATTTESYANATRC